MYKSKSECLVGTSRSYEGANSNTAKKSALTSLEAEVLPPSGCLSPMNQVIYTGCSWVQRTLCFFLHSFWKSCKISSLVFQIPILERMKYFLIYQGQFQIVNFSRFHLVDIIFPYQSPTMTLFD